MKTHPLTFGMEAVLPTRAYADTWPEYSRQHWQLYLAAYRAWVAQAYAELAEKHGSSFSLLGPVEILVVISLVREWVFVRHAETDTITLAERWEDPQLARWDMTRRADNVQRVRQVVGIGDEFRLLQASDHNLALDVHKAPTLYEGNVSFFARELADQHAANALAAPKWKKWTDALTGRLIDDAALKLLRGRLADFEGLSGAARGNRFEPWLLDLLAAHGCQVEKGKSSDGEQVDVFVHKPFRAIIECRWKQARLQPRELSDLTAKLGRRPAIVAGIYVAMSGFTDSTRKHALHEPNGRTVLLWDARDVTRLLNGKDHAMDIFEEHVSDRVRRYSAEDV